MNRRVPYGTAGDARRSHQDAPPSDRALVQTTGPTTSSQYAEAEYAEYGTVVLLVHCRTAVQYSK